MGFDLSPALISMKISLLSTTIIFFLGIMAAWAMTNYQGKFKGLLDGIFTLPLVLPPTVVGFAILLLIGKHGAIGQFLNIFGVKIIFSWPAAVIAAVVVAFPLMYKTSKGAFDQVDINTLNAARILGSSEWKVFSKVAVPMAWPGIAAATALSFARSLGEFGATLMVAGNIPGKTQTIPIAIYFATQGGDMRLAMIWGAIIISISLVVTILMNYWNRHQEGLISGPGRR